MAWRICHWLVAQSATTLVWVVWLTWCRIKPSTPWTTTLAKVVAVCLCLSSNCFMLHATKNLLPLKNTQDTIVFLLSPVLPTVRLWHWAMPAKCTSMMWPTALTWFRAARRTMVRLGAIMWWFSKVRRVAPTATTGRVMAMLLLPRSLMVQ